MIRELIASCHPYAIWRSVRGNHVDAGNLGLLAAIFGIAGNIERLPVPSQHRARSLVEPLRRSPDRSRRRTPSILSPVEHFHAVGHIVAVGGMHRLAIPRTAEMSEASSGNHASRT